MNPVDVAATFEDQVLGYGLGFVVLAFVVAMVVWAEWRASDKTQLPTPDADANAAKAALDQADAAIKAMEAVALAAINFAQMLVVSANSEKAKAK